MRSSRSLPGGRRAAVFFLMALLLALAAQPAGASVDGKGAVDA